MKLSIGFFRNTFLLKDSSTWGISDFEKGFIRAQTISYQDLIDSGSIAKAKTKGLLRSEGKEYVVNEGDVFLQHKL